MEESQSLTNSGRDRSAETGETLRSLREQADQTLDGHRRRLTNIESELNLHFQQITEELARDRVVDEMEVAASQKLQAEFQRCREMLTQVEGDLEGLRQEAEETHAQLDERTGELQQLREQLSSEAVEHDTRFVEQRAKCEQLRHQGETSQAECDRLSEKLHQLQETLAQTQGESDSFQEQFSALSAEHEAQLAKRDALAARVEELENAPPAESGVDNQQEFDDLQRRFEMAIDEVHQLKHDLAALQEQRRSVPDANSAIVDDDGPLDWQAQKALLLAELEAEENGGVAPERHETRTSIEETISRTDRVVAEKNQEIRQLQKQLESRPTEAPIAEAPPDPRAELFDQDELIQAERTRLEQITQEMDAKLREAELEISVKRATLAREQAALQEKLAQLPDEEVAEEDLEVSGKPRRRWLSALGLKEDEE